MVLRAQAANILERRSVAHFPINETLSFYSPRIPSGSSAFSHFPRFFPLFLPLRRSKLGSRVPVDQFLRTQRGQREREARLNDTEYDSHPRRGWSGDDVSVFSPRGRWKPRIAPDSLVTSFFSAGEKPPYLIPTLATP